MARAPRYVAPVVGRETGETALEILDAEPGGDHVRVDPGGAVAMVYLPGE